MKPQAAERRYLERQIAYARPVFMVLALVDLLERVLGLLSRTFVSSCTHEADSSANGHYPAKQFTGN